LRICKTPLLMVCSDECRRRLSLARVPDKECSRADQ
jgi:hypothetical protein